MLPPVIVVIYNYNNLHVHVQTYVSASYMEPAGHMRIAAQRHARPSQPVSAACIQRTVIRPLRRECLRALSYLPSYGTCSRRAYRGMLMVTTPPPPLHFHDLCRYPTRVRMGVMLPPALLPSLPITQGLRHARPSGTPAGLPAAPPAQQEVLPVVPPALQAMLPVVLPALTAQPAVLLEAQPMVPPRAPTLAPWQQHLTFPVTPAATVPMVVQMQPQRLRRR